MGGCVASVQFSRTGWEAHARANQAADAGLSKLNSMLAGCLERPTPRSPKQ